MLRKLDPSAVVSIFLGLTLSSTPLFAQTKPAPAASASSAISPEKAIALGEEGRCKEAIPVLKRVMSSQGPAETRKKAGIVGLRCSLPSPNPDVALDFIRVLSKQFLEDPDVLFVLVHAYSDLSTRTAQDLGRTAPQSVPAHKLNAEALEMQGKWDEAQREYEVMIEKEPNSPGLHFLLGRLLLSRPDPDGKFADRAKQEFQKEIEIDPKNAGAHYVLGELARQKENWEEAIGQFSEAAKLDPNFAEAYFGWGFSLVNARRYQEAIAPLRVAERLTPGNPSVHYSLATALIRTGQKEEAEKEFAIHRSLTESTPPPAATDNTNTSKPQ
ncbi:MAG: tetratricopeptide repeat protein [Candidatus Acidiferrum sp.]